jgi:hypothetical protein
MDILITGARFCRKETYSVAEKHPWDGKDKTTNLTSELNILEYDIDSAPEPLDAYNG